MQLGQSGTIVLFFKNMDRYSIEQVLLPNHYIVRDKRNGIYCLFEQGRFCETNAVSEIPAGLSVTEIVTLLRDMTQWIESNHKDKI